MTQLKKTQQYFQIFLEVCIVFLFAPQKSRNMLKNIAVHVCFFPPRFRVAEHRAEVFFLRIFLGEGGRSI